jgi:hypothetical protein
LVSGDEVVVMVEEEVLDTEWEVVVSGILGDSSVVDIIVFQD